MGRSADGYRFDQPAAQHVDDRDTVAHPIDDIERLLASVQSDARGVFTDLYIARYLPRCGVDKSNTASSAQRNECSLGIPGCREAHRGHICLARSRHLELKIFRYLVGGAIDDRDLTCQFVRNPKLPSAPDQ